MTSRIPAMIQLLTLFGLLWLQSVPLVNAQLPCSPCCEPQASLSEEVTTISEHACCRGDAPAQTLLLAATPKAWECCTLKTRLAELSKSSVTVSVPVKAAPVFFEEVGRITDFTWAHVRVHELTPRAEPHPLCAGRVMQFLGVLLL